MDTDHLLERITEGDSSAAHHLLARHEKRLRRMVALRELNLGYNGICADGIRLLTDPSAPYDTDGQLKLTAFGDFIATRIANHQASMAALTTLAPLLAASEGPLDALLELSPPHVSLYGLTIEPGTPFARATERGQITEVDEDLWRAMYDRIVQRLHDAGIERYEVSNFARRGHASRHNSL